MKKKVIGISAAAVILAAFVIFFALQATPSNVLNLVRAEGLAVDDGVLIIPESYTVIEAEAVAGKTDIDTVIIQGEAEIGARAFYGCPNLREVVIERACDIGEGAFADCPYLKSVTINSAEGSCAEDAFDGHGGLVMYCREGSEALEVAQRADMSYEIIE